MVPSDESDPAAQARVDRWTAAAYGGWPGLPERPHQFVGRPRLLDRLDADPECSLILVSAPAGTGKTTMVADWAATRHGERLEWITFDPGDALWPPLVAALERLGVEVPRTAVPIGDTALDPRLRRELALGLAGTDPVTLVIDGYVVESAVVAADLDFLLRHSGHRLRLVLLTRADPVLPLYRYRLEESMVEVRMSDLALTDEEADALLRQMGVELSPDAVHALNERTSGWVTGTRFAGRFLGEHDDPDHAINEVFGESGSIAEYLIGEVLAVHPPDVVDLLMAMSVPDTIEPCLAEELGGPGAVRVLGALARVNVFLETVPGETDHFRLHPFFRDLLRAELGYRFPERAIELHRRTAAWFAREGRIVPAVRHRAAVGAWDDVAELVVERAVWAELLLAPQSHPLVQVLRSMPPTVEGSPAILVRAALALTEDDTARFDSSGFDDVLAALAEQPDEITASEPGVTLAASVLRAVRARSHPDPQEAHRLAAAAVHAATADRAVAGSSEAAGLTSLVLATQAVAELRHAPWAQAREQLRDGDLSAEADGCLPLHVECLGLQAVVACADGDLARAESEATCALRVAADAGLGTADRSASPEIALAWVAMEQFDLRNAGAHLEAAEQSRFVLADPVSRAMLAVVKSRQRAAQGDRAAAIAALETARDELGAGDRSLDARLRLELAPSLVARGDLEGARAAVHGIEEPGLGPSLALVSALVQLADGDDEGATADLSQALEPGAPLPVRVTALLAECTRLTRIGAMGHAQETIVEALETARPQSLRRPFHEAAPSVRQLVLKDRRLAATHAWLFERPGRSSVHRPAAVTRRSAPVVVEPHVAPVEELTAKELEVLGHLAALLTTEEIASEMYISVNTVRTHVRNILRKLGVSRRNAAVRIAREFELLQG